MLRRTFIGSVATLACLSRGAVTSSAWLGPFQNYTLDLCPGRIGVKVSQAEAIELAHRHGFQSIEPQTRDLLAMSRGELELLQASMQTYGLKWGAASLDVNFRGSAAEFEQGLAELASTCKRFQQAGVTRIGTWLSPAHQELTYRANFSQHTQRLRAIAEVLNEHQIRFGLEYVGPKTSWSSKRFPFVHTLVETLELIEAIGQTNVGLVLDSWHWYCAGETLDDLKPLRNEQIVAVDLNDAPAGVQREQQMDNRRELPAATGVIDVRGFLGVLQQIGYDGPVRAEPFNQSLNDLENEPAVQVTAAAMRKAIGL